MFVKMIVIFCVLCFHAVSQMLLMISIVIFFPLSYIYDTLCCMKIFDLFKFQGTFVLFGLLAAIGMSENASFIPKIDCAGCPSALDKNYCATYCSTYGGHLYKGFFNDGYMVNKTNFGIGCKSFTINILLMQANIYIPLTMEIFFP